MNITVKTDTDSDNPYVPYVDVANEPGVYEVEGKSFLALVVGDAASGYTMLIVNARGAIHAAGSTSRTQYRYRKYNGRLVLTFAND